MQYMHKDWKLYSKEVYLRNHPKPFKIYFFSKKQPKSGFGVEVEEFQKMKVFVKENPRTGMPYIKKVR